ncbi:hypothetical protein ACH42_06220 [Endozoicomonas sp. (ex Bugula neritina AB1)]|nr:hypothetical protein ACH42_06220 [Endozoicomonas sp. (ex Bugula neritina AB1)]
MNKSDTNHQPEDILNALYQVPELAELPLPESIAFMPQTTGWVVLSAVIISVLLMLLFRRYRQWQRDLWRREARKLLSHARTKQSPEYLPTLIKRVLLRHVSRSEVTDMNSPDWLEQFTEINKRLGINIERINFMSAISVQLSSVAYTPSNSLTADQVNELFDLVSLWLEELPRV